MYHLGDITKISGYTAPVVDCIIGGSPCQDLSVAGKRAGLDGERSGLYIEQVRIVKEMREQDERNGRSGVDIRPRYMVWENVPGAFSSNKGEDFRIVLEELAKVADQDAVIPMPDTGKWTSCGCIMGDGWSIAWRVLDAQFWGVPQRRRRIALVADFGGQSAPEILFVSQSLSGHTEPSQQKRKATSSDATRGFGADDSIGVDIYNTALTGDKVCPLTAGGTTSTGTCPKVMTPITFEPGITAREGGHIYEGVSGTLRAHAGDNQMATAYTLKIRSGCEGGGKGALVQTDKSATLSTLQDQTLFQPVLALDRASFNQGKNAQYDFEVSDKGVNSPIVAKGPGAVCYSVDQGGGKSSVDVREGKSPTLTTTHDGAPAICYPEVKDGVVGTLDAHYSNFPGMRGGMERTMVAQAVDCRNGTEDSVNGALQSNSAHSLNGNNVVRTRYIVRRFTPLECERLQGYPDGWTDIGEYIDSNGKKRQTSDAARYKALGNSIALPPWKWVLKRICACYERDATMGSLFDGISGFVLLWTQLNGLGSVKWTSEIEEFPVAVCKRHFGDEETGEKGDFYEAILGRNKTENV